MTNVCGIAPESMLKELDALVNSYQPLAERLAKLSRAWKWIATGPLAYERRYEGLRCGDALGFIDPFTGSGILHALWSGRLAGIAAARGTPVAEYHAQCRRALRRPFAAAAVIRKAIENHFGALSLVTPVSLLYRATRIQPE
jgi:flavin-dependent dehydrogenase